MPNKAKLVTRTEITSTVTTDNIPKDDTLTYAELDSNLINLRDATFGLAGDDSATIEVGMGNTIKIAGSGSVTTSATGQTVTITAPSLDPYALKANTAITVVGDDSTGTNLAYGETVKIAGGNNITTAVSGDTLTITGSKIIDVNEINSGDSSAIQINDAVNVSGTFNAKTIVTNDLISQDSSAINVLDGLNVSGTLSADVLDVNEISSGDSTAIQVNDNLNISGTLSVAGDITSADSLQFDTTSTETVATGKLYYSGDYGTLAHGLSDGTELIDGVDLVTYVTNAEANTLTKGEVVYIFGASGDRPSVKRADNSGDPTSSKTLGIVKNNITAGSAGYVVTQGIITGLNLGAYTAGDVLWLDTAGAFTATKPTHPAHLVFVGVVLRANAGNGLVYVKPQNGYELDELHDVNAGTAVANDVLKYDGTAWVNTPGGELIYNGNSITAASNADIDLTAGGTGNINLNADTIRLGDSGANATLTTNGAGDIIINTNSGTNSGSITIADGANGNIELVTDGTGKVNINKVLSAANYPFTPISTNFPAYDSASIRGTTILFSDLAVPNITTDAGKYRVNNRIVSTKADSSGTTYNNTSFLIQNTDLTLFDLNGATASGITARGTGVRGQATNCILTNSGGGTKTAPNIFGGAAFTEIVEGHGGDLTVPNVIAHRSVNSIRANTGETTRVTNVFGYVADTTLTAGTGALATRVITNDYGFFAAPSTTTNVSTNYYGFFVNSGGGATNKYAFYSADDAYLSRIGTVERYREKISALTFSASIAVDTDLAPIFTVTLTGNTDFTLKNLSTGQTVTIIVTQDGTGGRTATFSTESSTAVKFAAGSATLSTAGNAIDVVRIVNDGTNYLGILDKGFA